jgi:hypothetical protein
MLVVSENVTLDGVIQDPAGTEGFRHGGWVGRVGDRGREGAAKALLDEALGAASSTAGRSMALSASSTKSPLSRRPLSAVGSCVDRDATRARP